MNPGVNENNRVEWIDAAKGIGIIIVILGHIWLKGTGQKYISSFHMPLFFFLSGYVFSFGKYRDIKQLLWTNINKILIPYAWFSFFTYSYWVFFERHVSGNTISPMSAFINIFMCQGADKYLPHNPALWFLPCLFVVQLMFYYIAKNRKREYLPLSLVTISIMSYFITIFIPGHFPWSINVALTGVVFYGIGFVIKSYMKLSLISNRIILSVFVTAVTLGLVISLQNTYVMMAANLYGNFFYFYAAALLNILGIIAISFLLRKNNWLIYLGRNSLTIFALHFPIKRLVVGLSGIFFNITSEQIKASFLISSLDTIITIIILLPIIHLIRTHFTFILGTTRAYERSSLEE